MRTLIVYDSYFGNTKKVAEAIAAELGEDTRVTSVRDVGDADLAGLDLLIVGSPILGWKPSERIEKFLGGFREGRLRGIKAAAFDTRVKLFIHGDAAHKISSALERAGATVISKPKAFFVKGKEGPLFDGELEKAAKWGREMAEKM